MIATNPPNKHSYPMVFEFALVGDAFCSSKSLRLRNEHNQRKVKEWTNNVYIEVNNTKIYSQTNVKGMYNMQVTILNHHTTQLRVRADRVA